MEEAVEEAEEAVVVEEEVAEVSTAPWSVFR